MAKPNDTPKASFNCHLKGMKSDFLYHIGFSRDEVKDLFHDVKVQYSNSRYNCCSMISEPCSVRSNGW